MTVTAAVDRITLKHPLSEICDLQLSGQVTFATGRSSMEVSLQVSKAPKDGELVKAEDILMTCAFTMVRYFICFHSTYTDVSKVSLDPQTKRPVPIAPLKTTSPQEKALFDLGEKNYNLKKASSKLALRKQTPNDEEADLIHALWLAQLDYHDPNTPTRKPEMAVSMSNTQIQYVSTTSLLSPPSSLITVFHIPAGPPT